jgi:hypothetical protein
MGAFSFYMWHLMAISSDRFRFYENCLMRKTASVAVQVVFFICFIGCSKDNNSTNASSLSGNWTFVGIKAQTSSTDTDNEAGEIFKTITTSSYTSISNGGTLGISGNTMTGTGITYTINDTSLVKDYDNNVLTDTFSYVFPPIKIPPTNSTSTFEVIGTDSIHYVSGSMLGSGGTSDPAASGARFSISGNLLTLTSNIVQDKIVDTLGTTIMEHEEATVITTLQKQ